MLFSSLHSFILASALVASVTSTPLRTRNSTATSLGLSNSLITKVKANLASHSTDTWVSGTRAQALLELDYPSLSVYSPTSPWNRTLIPTSINTIAAEWYAIRSSNATQFAEIQGGAAADPASLGVAFILAAESLGSTAYATAVEEEVDYLLNTVKRTTDGAISMRPNEEAVQLWADYIYMVPPFLAAYGVSQGNYTVLLEAFTQIKLYRSYLIDPEGSGLWRHVVLGNWGDAGLWGTGNAWAAAGMVRVLATMVQSPYKNRLKAQIRQLAAWTDEILVASFAQIGNDNLLPNYYGVTTTFSDAASSALLASASYRLAFLNQKQTKTNLATAHKIRATVNSKVNAQTGWLAPVVDPLEWKEEVTQSPEGQAFVLLLEAAWRDWYGA